MIDKAGILDSGLLLAIAAGLFIGPHTVHGNRSPLRLSRVAPVSNSASNSDHGIPLERLLSRRRSRVRVPSLPIDYLQAFHIVRALRGYLMAPEVISC